MVHNIAIGQEDITFDKIKTKRQINKRHNMKLKFDENNLMIESQLDNFKMVKEGFHK
jgi:hypothetical protein